MEWDKIQLKWSAMASRICSDARSGMPEDILVFRRSEAKNAVSGSIVADEKFTFAVGIPQKRRAASTS